MADPVGAATFVVFHGKICFLFEFDGFDDGIHDGLVELGLRVGEIDVAGDVPAVFIDNPPAPGDDLVAVIFIIITHCDSVPADFWLVADFPGGFLSEFQVGGGFLQLRGLGSAGHEAAIDVGGT